MMRIELITTGEELLDGRVCDRNSSEISGVLFQHGFAVAQVTVIGDDPETLYSLIQTRSQTAQVLILTGGLGPTSDDYTRSVLARLSHKPLKSDPAIVKRLRSYYQDRNLPITDLALSQAAVPEGAVLIANPVGLAPGICIRLENGGGVYALPGVPAEMRCMLQNYVVPELISKRCEKTPFFKLYKIFGLREYQVADRLKSLMLPSEVEIGYQIRFPEIAVRLRITSDMATAAEIAFWDQEITDRLAPFIYGTDQETFFGKLGEQLAAKGLIFAVAESCTGGMLSQMITAIPGASRYFWGSVVAYHNQIKQDFLAVPAPVLKTHGAVSESVARLMAEGVRKRFSADIGLSVTGIAGPDGGTPEKPVGTVFIACATKQDTVAQQFSFAYDRERMQKMSAYSALEMLRQQVL